MLLSDTDARRNPRWIGIVGPQGNAV